MFLAHPLDLLAVAHQRADDLRREAAVARLRSAATAHRLASSLRCLANRLDRRPLAARTA